MGKTKNLTLAALQAAFVTWLFIFFFNNWLSRHIGTTIRYSIYFALFLFLMFSVYLALNKQSFQNYFRLFRALLKNRRVPWLAKASAILAIVYFFCPIDLIPDWIPIIGYMDDPIIIGGLLWLAMKLTPKDVYDEMYEKYVGSQK